MERAVKLLQDKGVEIQKLMITQAFLEMPMAV